MAMLSCNLCTTCMLLVLPIVAIISIFHSSVAGNGYGQLRRAGMEVFWQDDFNYTDFVVVEGVKGMGTEPSPISGPFGTMAVFNDPITEGPDRYSPQLGSIQGTTVVSAFDGLTSFSAATITLNSANYNGSLTFQGPLVSNGSTTSIVGGTGDFMFVQGYVVNKPINVLTFNTTTSLYLSLFWAPYGLPPPTYFSVVVSFFGTVLKKMIL